MNGQNKTRNAGIGAHPSTSLRANSCTPATQRPTTHCPQRLSSMTDVTHLCHFDIPLLSKIPNLVYLAPTNREEYLAMLDWSLSYREHPVAIRVPVGVTLPATRPVPTDYSALNTYEVVERGKDVAILALGNFFSLGERVCRLLEAQGRRAPRSRPGDISGGEVTWYSVLQVLQNVFSWN